MWPVRFCDRIQILLFVAIRAGVRNLNGFCIVPEPVVFAELVNLHIFVSFAMLYDSGSGSEDGLRLYVYTL